MPWPTKPCKIFSALLSKSYVAACHTVSALHAILRSIRQRCSKSYASAGIPQINQVPWKKASTLRQQPVKRTTKLPWQNKPRDNHHDNRSGPEHPLRAGHPHFHRKSCLLTLWMLLCFRPSSPSFWLMKLQIPSLQLKCRCQLSLPLAYSGWFAKSFVCGQGPCAPAPVTSQLGQEQRGLCSPGAEHLFKESI